MTPPALDTVRVTRLCHGEHTPLLRICVPQLFMHPAATESYTPSGVSATQSFDEAVESPPYFLPRSLHLETAYDTNGRIA